MNKFLYSTVSSLQSALHFTHWQTCSFQCQFDFSGKHSATLHLLCKYYSFTYPPLYFVRCSVIQLSELRQLRVNKIAHATKRQQEDSNYVACSNACVRAFVCACVRACVCAFMCACIHICNRMCVSIIANWNLI